ncbi:4-demethylwyosine synthase TYW1 [archaeon]|nr:4-demethylwyosine synthase TYW1 [archaeon]PJC45530.1 MAG: 4-demethylwyosine synthase TYW1 [Candidatus Pacearchaeota archaeon CG_4_9_14_0_2_um_filter_30_8]
MAIQEISKEKQEQLNAMQKRILTRQGYRLVGSHSAVKICEWTKKSLRGEGNCYKCTFYGIRSHQCLQMTTSMFCASRCKFCWRGQKAPVGKTWYGPVDSPEHIINHSIDNHLSLLEGFNSHKKITPTKKEEFKEVRHVALSLTGEPITYPLINEILEAFHKRRISTFLVTNAQFPEAIEKIKNVTQLYLSIDAPTKEKLKKIDRPLFNDYWERMNKCLDLLATRKYRTCIRLSLIKEENMENFEEYSKLIQRGSPDFIELKSYMWVGESQKHYKVQNMPYLEDMKEFTKKILEFLPEYEYLSRHEPSRAILLGKKSLNKKHWINFPKFFELVESGEDFEAVDYCSEVMQPNK